MSSSYHPETDGSSERSNKTVEQAPRYHVDRNQKGWVKALPLIRFNMMNTVNVSTGFSPFQLRMGRSPRIIPPLATSTPLSDIPDDIHSSNAVDLINALTLDTMQAQDNLLAAKVAQAEFANRRRTNEVVFTEGERVLLSTKHRRREYMQSHSDRVTKFMPRFDGPFEVIRAHLETSDYTLLLPNEPNRFPTFHSSLLRKYNPNDYELFPSCSLPQPGPVITPDGQEEWVIRDIIDERTRGRGKQYLVRWMGWGDEENRWLSGRDVAEAEALDRWLAR